MNLLKKNLLVLTVLLLSVFLSDCSCGKKVAKAPPSTDKTVQISTNPASAEILANGRSIGYGNATIKIKMGQIVSVEVKDQKFMPMTPRVFDYTSSSTAASFPSSYFDLAALGPNPAYTGTSEASYANKYVSLPVKNGRTAEESFAIVSRTISNYFDAIEVQDKNAGYFRTAWVGTKWATQTDRIRVLVTKESDDPLSYQMKFIVETAKAGTAFDYDTDFAPYNRIPKKYDGFYEELATKLRN